VFESENAGLIIAEVEISSTTQAIELLSWVGTEVSEDPRYFNANLVEAPIPHAKCSLTVTARAGSCSRAP